MRAPNGTRRTPARRHRPRAVRLWGSIDIFCTLAFRLWPTSEPFSDRWQHVLREALAHAVDVPAHEGRVAVANSKAVETRPQQLDSRKNLPFLRSGLEENHRLPIGRGPPSPMRAHPVRESCATIVDCFTRQNRRPSAAHQSAISFGST